MARSTILLKDGVVIDLHEKLDNAVLFQHGNIGRCVKYFWTLDEACLSHSDNPGPYHDREWELFILGVNMVALFHQPHNWAVGGCGKPRLVCEECLRPIIVLMNQTERQSRPDVTLYQTRAVPERLVSVRQVVTDAVDRRLT